MYARVLLLLLCRNTWIYRDSKQDNQNEIKIRIAQFMGAGVAVHQACHIQLAAIKFFFFFAVLCRDAPNNSFNVPLIYSLLLLRIQKRREGRRIELLRFEMTLSGLSYVKITFKDSTVNKFVFPQLSIGTTQLPP